MNCSVLIDDNLRYIEEVERAGIIGIPLGSWSWTQFHPRAISSWIELEI
jgi:hypothetical protein